MYMIKNSIFNHKSVDKPLSCVIASFAVSNFQGGVHLLQEAQREIVMIFKMFGNLAAPKLFSAATVFCLVLLPVDLFGQTTRTVLGQVSHPFGVAVPAATVTATNIGTEFTRKGVINAQGSYIMPALPIGTYKLTIQAPGFKTFAKTGITLQVGQNARFDVSLANLPLLRFNYISDFQDNSHTWGEYACSGLAPQRESLLLHLRGIFKVGIKNKALLPAG